jgi:hypothetical protein
MQEENRIFMNREERERQERYRYSGYSKPEKTVKPEKETEPND